MDLVAKLSASERNELFTETAVTKSMTPAVVEKDFWVTWTLGKIFDYRVMRNMIYAVHIFISAALKTGPALYYKRQSGIFPVIIGRGVSIKRVQKWGRA
jgi:hypothetical protein